eukprot:1968210-Amphidinium_carterae.1
MASPLLVVALLAWWPGSAGPVFADFILAAHLLSIPVSLGADPRLKVPGWAGTGGRPWSGL